MQSNKCSLDGWLGLPRSASKTHNPLGTARRRQHTNAPPELCGRQSNASAKCTMCNTISAHRPNKYITPAVVRRLNPATNTWRRPTGGRAGEAVDEEGGGELTLEEGSARWKCPTAWCWNFWDRMLVEPSKEIGPVCAPTRGQERPRNDRDNRPMLISGAPPRRDRTRNNAGGEVGQSPGGGRPGGGTTTPGQVKVRANRAGAPR